MVVVYTANGDKSSRIIRKYLKENKVEYIEKDLGKVALEKKEIQYLLSKTDNGFEDLISTRSKYLKENKIDFNDLTMKEAIDIVSEHPTVLKRPILLTEKFFKIGYDQEEFEDFKKRYVS